MARGADLIAQLARKPLHIQLGVLAGVLAALGFLYWQFFYSSLAEQEQTLMVERKKLAKQEQKLKERVDEWKELLQKKKDLDEALEKNQVTLPASSELPAFFAYLQKQAATAGVSVSRWGRLKESAVASYVKVPVSMNVTGTFYQVTNYFRLLAQADRIITVEGLSLKKGREAGEDVILSATFTAATFRQKDRPPDTSFADPEEDADKGAAEAPAKGGGE